jgi:hypothetical protein
VTFGRVEYFLVLDADVIAELIDLDQERDTISEDDSLMLTETLALAVISPIPSFKRLNDCNLVTYELPRGRLGPVEIVDVEDVICLVGRVQDHASHWYIVDRTTVVGQIDFVNSLADLD